MALRHAGENRGRHEETLRRQTARRLPHFRPFLHPGVEVAQDRLELGARHNGAHIGVLVQRVAHAQDAQTALEFGHDGVRHGLLHEQTRTGAADLPLVEEDAVDDALDGLVDRRVVKDDVGGLAAEFHRHPFVATRHRTHDDLAHLG